MTRFQLSLTEKSKAVKHHVKAGIGALAIACLTLLPGIALHAQDADATPVIKARLSSLNQVPAVLAPSSGSFEARIGPDATVSFSLTYYNASSAVTQAHIHFGASRTNGGVAVFLCGGQKPACPASGTVTGVITAEDVSTLPVTNGDSVIPQGMTPGDLAGLFEAIRTGNTYVNVHTANFPTGELRGQVEFAGQGRAQ
jgi:CHRD domain